MRKKCVAVTAPTSAVARNFINHVKKQYEIITVGRRESDVYFDFGKNEIVNLPDGISSIIHFAGVLHANEDEGILDMSNVNVSGILRLCMTARRNGITQVINISSINSMVTHDSMYYGWYSLTKRQGEETAKLYCSQNGINLSLYDQVKFSEKTKLMRRHNDFFM